MMNPLAISVVRIRVRVAGHAQRYAVEFMQYRQHLWRMKRSTMGSIEIAVRKHTFRLWQNQ